MGEDPELFFKRCPGGEFTDDNGLNCTVESWSLVRELRENVLCGGALRQGYATNYEVEMAMVVVRCACLGVVTSWYIRLASDLVGLESPGSFHRFCSVPYKSGNRHLITERSHSTEDESNLPIVPIRGCLEKIRRLLKGHEYVGRGSSQRGLGRGLLCNSYKVSVFGRKLAIQKITEEIRANPKLREHLPRLSGETLICHCLPSQECHADSIIAEYKLLFPVLTIERIRRVQFRHRQYDGDYQSYDKSPNRMGGLPQMRVSQRKVQGLDVEARSWLGQVTPCVRFATDSRSRRLVAGRWRTEGTQRILVWSQVSRRYMDYAESWHPRVVDLVGMGKVSSCPFLPPRLKS